MNNIRTALKTLAKGSAYGVLAEILSTAGSTPRGPGAQMLLLPDGTFSGTVGGGTLEYKAQQKALDVLRRGIPDREMYSLRGDPNAFSIGVCGGTAVVDFRLLSPSDAARLLETMPAPPRILLYGAGHVGKALADAACLVGLDVIVTDDREILLTPERFPHADRVLHALPDAPMAPAPQDLIVIMTHGHEHDFELVRRAMKTPAAYVGLMASRKKAAIAQELLARDGYAPEEIARRLHCPIGLPIHAETPEEIAVSILGEIISLLRAPEVP